MNLGSYVTRFYYRRYLEAMMMIKYVINYL